MVARSIRSILGGGNLNGPRSAPLAPLGPCERAEGAFCVCERDICMGRAGINHRRRYTGTTGVSDARPWNSRCVGCQVEGEGNADDHRRLTPC